MGGKGSKTKNKDDLTECDPDAGQHIHNYTKQCENKGCNALVCKFCRKEYGDKDVCIDCYEVLESLANGKGLDDLLNTDGMDKESAAIAQGMMKNDQDIKGLMSQMNSEPQTKQSFNTFARDMQSGPPAGRGPPPRGQAAPRSTQPRGAPPKSQQPRGPPPATSKAPVRAATRGPPPRPAGQKAGPRAKARGAPPPPPRATKARPRGNPEGFKAAAEELKANLDPWGMPIQSSGGGGSEQPSQPRAPQPGLGGGEMTMAEQLAAQAGRLKAPKPKGSRPLPPGATLSFDEQIRQNAEALKHKEKRVIKKDVVEDNSNPFANVLKPKRAIARNTEVIDPKKLQSLQEPVSVPHYQKPEPVKVQVKSVKKEEVKKEEPVKPKPQPLPRKSEALPSQASKVQVSQSEYEQFLEFQKFKAAQESAAQQQYQEPEEEEMGFDQEEEDEEDSQAMMIAQIAAARKKVRMTIKDSQRNKGGN